MKLQGKKAIQNQANIQKKQQIDEGVILATRIDELRRTFALEQQNLSLYRDRSIDALQKDLEPLMKQKASLADDIKNLQQEKKQLIDLPIEATNKEIAERKAKIAVIESVLAITELAMVQKEIDIAAKEVKLAADIEKVSHMKAEISRIHDKMLSDGRQAESFLDEADKKLQEIQGYCKSQKEVLDEYEQRIQYREVDLDNRQRIMNEKEIYLNERERQVNDRYQTLERTIKRLKK